MYFDIILQGNTKDRYTVIVLLVCIVPSSFIMCDMLNGSVERIVSSSRLLLFLERVRILNWIIQRRQKSYHVHTQVYNQLTV